MWVHERIEIHRTEVNVVSKNYLKFDKRFRELRPDKTCCELCREKFADEEHFHIAFTNKGNKLICNECAEIAQERGSKVTEWPKATGSTE